MANITLMYHFIILFYTIFLIPSLCLLLLFNGRMWLTIGWKNKRIEKNDYIYYV